MIKNEIELDFLAMFVLWKRCSTEDGHKFYSGGRNTQTARLIFVLNLIADHFQGKDYNAIFLQLAKRTTRKKDNNSFLSQDSSWMREPHTVRGDWYFEGCTNLRQKQVFMQNIRKMRFPGGFQFSPQFSGCVDDFLEYKKSLEKYEPTKDDKEAFDCYQEKLNKFNNL